MSDMDHPLTSSQGLLWLGQAPPESGGRGFALTPDRLVLRMPDEEDRHVGWEGVTWLRVAMKESRWRRPAVVSWSLGLFGAGIGVWSPDVPGEVEIRVDADSGSVEHTVSAHNRGGYPAAMVRSVEALLELLVDEPQARPPLAVPGQVRDWCRDVASRVAEGEDPHVLLRDRLVRGTAS